MVRMVFDCNSLMIRTQILVGYNDIPTFRALSAAGRGEKHYMLTSCPTSLKVLGFYNKSDVWRGDVS